jgi:hypothetical protein
VRAFAVQIVNQTRVAAPTPLTIDAIAGMLTAVVGVPIQISCDPVGVPSPLDGHTLDPADDGEVFWSTDTRGVAVVVPIIHVSAQTCWDARQANRQRDPNPLAYFTYQGKRVDNISGAPFQVLLHEAFHIGLQSGDEARVECAAISNAWPLVRQLRLPPFAAQMMLVGMSQRHAQAPPAYRSDC